MSCEETAEPAYFGIDPRHQSPKMSAKRLKPNLQTLRTLNEDFLPVMQVDVSLPSHLKRVKSPRVAKASSFSIDLQTIIEKTYSDIYSVRQNAFASLAVKISEEDLGRLAHDPNVVSQLLFKKLIGTVSSHLTDEVRPVALEAYKCGSSLFENKLVNRLLLPYVEDFLEALAENVLARKTLV